MVVVNALKLAASTLAIGAVFASGVSASDQSSQAASASQVRMMKVASTAAAIARKAIASNKGALAVTHAEKAVAAMPQDESYRMLLGESYLSAGRFASAETAFADVLSLDAGNSRAALKMALSMIAVGKQVEALEVLDANRDRILDADYGLALTLAGNAGAALPILDVAARSENASAKVRQNLAFAHAMSNNWAAARRIAGQDLTSDLVTKRIMEWAALARPKTSADQVAGILGVTPAFDPGQPAMLALGVVEPQNSGLAAAEVPVSQAEVAAAAPSVSMPLEEVVAEEAQPVQVAAMVEPAPAAQQIVFGPRQEIVQAIPAARRSVPLIRAASKPMKRMPAKQVVVPASRQKSASVAPAPRAVETGRYAVQLGAYSSPQRAEQNWNRIAGKVSELRGYDPQSARIRVKTASLFRLSVTGFAAREDASRVCTKIKASGADCFIRSTSGDSPLRMALRTSKGGTRIASARR
jgi:Flp pilus assembly protein TadD